jgi:hypothetical protein
MEMCDLRISILHAGVSRLCLSRSRRRSGGADVGPQFSVWSCVATGTGPGGRAYSMAGRWR